MVRLVFGGKNKYCGEAGVKVAVDLMGGDFAPGALLDGCLLYLIKSVTMGVELHLVATAEVFQDAIFKQPEFAAVKHVTCGSHVLMGESPLTIKKEKADASIVVCMELLQQGEVDVVYSAGHSGATVLSALSLLGLQKGVSYPAILSFVRLAGGGFVAMADCGASANKVVSSKILVDFAQCSSRFCSRYFQKDAPRIGLLNIGSEPGKGTDEHRKAFQVLIESDLNFVGNVEADKLLSSGVDVIVTDGFTGNIVVKMMESLYDSGKKEDGSALVDGLPRVKYEEIGGGPLLGVKGRVVIAHGKSSADAVVSGLELCRLYAAFKVDC